MVTIQLLSQAEIDSQNAQFWNTLCGSTLAQTLGITDGSAESLKKFDDWYLDYYPYLLTHVPVHTMLGKDVLDIGLGYGTLAQKIAEAGARYTGLDIAAGPVSMVESRMQMTGLPGKAVQGNMLNCPFPDESFDCVVSIGCFHHTGDTQQCLDETLRVLRPGGHAYLMLYNRFSYRQWKQFPGQTFSAALREIKGYSRYERTVATNGQRAAYDTDLSGKAAPETDFFSIKQIKSMMAEYAQVDCYKENCDHVANPQTGEIIQSREQLLPTRGKRLGLDIYIHAVK